MNERSPIFAETRPRRAAFSLVELLVVIAIIAALTSMLLPAVHASRRSARRTLCQNNQHQIGIALQSHHSALGRFPVGGIEWRGPRQPEKRQLAWSAFLLPYLEEHALADVLDLSTPFDSPENAVGAAKIVSVYVCPSSHRGARLVLGRGPCDYGGMYGERLTSPNRPPKGTMLYDTRISHGHIRDGLSNTIIVAEDSHFDDGQWINGRNVFDQAYAVNAAPLWENDMRSDHSGGAYATFADGSVRYIDQTMAIRPLAALCTRDGQEVAPSFP